MKSAFITGITGQDGSYLAEFLLSKGYEVHGLIRRASTFNTGRIDHLYIDPHIPGAKMFLHYGDLSDSGQFTSLIYNIKPDEIYHLGAQSHVRVSFDMPEYTGDISALGTTRLLEAIRRSGIKTKFYQASSSEMFGATPPPQHEKSLFYPRSPYAAAKLYAYWITVNYREGYNLFACNGILFNHESPRRGETFVTRKITRALANILAGNQKKLYLGNMNAKRDWGFAPEYVEMMWLMLQQNSPDDYVVGTGNSYSVREFVEKAFRYAGIELEWKGSGKDEKGIISSRPQTLSTKINTGDVVIEIDQKYFRPTEVEYLKADITKAKTRLRWEPRITFDELVKIMVDYDMKILGLEPPCEGIDASRNKGFSYTNHDFSLYEKIREGC
ncbi:MAG: GDP-mannose 4,6-dehydratase [Planctomycetia bacterium]|uniref:GDP-mannose 4,6-dehydratase n=1 Tax=Candidatus Brocadia sapporoensis TaxID=392547 RepID=A0A1V6LZZ2_9BACT|nr:GDP-mannose 4,6-dehydratase [Candidatus Brocadia sapporoensis]MCC7238930.1 GDP-mannose 4,6-dehydratase [Candidatus Brocadia sp.]QOJ05884.1 MAG: GDP-mannose 4,6-dehydratase [Planctomycetia bacterium]TVL95321.1 MAG: GDP-mannose 4,6-dehydratase [Candidatus Brocadia sp. BL1]MDG6004519.1 GDP-mannose 4,6-dehydratase [Candidatus Brocadia sp.]OQD45685.1 GDP-mannose 4,6-dehydratase [Candidatus Brocadia sapporoensis]